MHVDKVLAVMPDGEEPIENVFERLNARIIELAKMGREHCLINYDDFRNFHARKDIIAGYYYLRGFDVRVLDDTVLVSWQGKSLQR